MRKKGKGGGKGEGGKGERMREESNLKDTRREPADVLLAVLQVAAAVQRGVGHKQQPPLHFDDRQPEVSSGPPEAREPGSESR
ncbi:hypothetical protein EYF80_020252 [Liparis tanakae]|uniref:Uncharacterized protein n=1 Tax=Liparis tanakae TaxID=230148 RepID=A0A4Z2HV80_9TELE|nr:hypothetical protein EYF80_020252 [Liparis tanakae]